MEEWLVFRLAASEWALPAQKVRQVLRPRPVTRVPGAVPPLRGLISWRANVLPVIALDADCAYARPSSVGRVYLVVETDKGLVALEADEVVGFIHDPIADPPGEQRTGPKVLDLEQMLDGQ